MYMYIYYTNIQVYVYICLNLYPFNDQVWQLEGGNFTTKNRPTNYLVTCNMGICSSYRFPILSVRYNSQRKSSAIVCVSVSPV